MKDGSHTYLNFSDVGIYIDAEGNFTIRNCRISSISIGIYLDFGVSTDYIHSIQGVESNGCGISILSPWIHIAVNVSKCDISNCNWVTVKVPDDLDDPTFPNWWYGGFGIYVNSKTTISVIEFCHIQDCSIGVFAGRIVSLISNQLFSCGFLIDFGHVLENDVNNFVNDKPLGVFKYMDNLFISGQEAYHYGQLIFIACHNLHLSNIHITESCSFGLLIQHCNHAVLQNIVCENQQIGFFIDSIDMTADYLYAKNCDVGFGLIQIAESTLNRLLTDNTDVPIYTYSPILNTTIGIEKSTRFCIIDHYGIDELQINSSASSIIVPRTNMSEFEMEGFIIRLDEIDTYHIADLDPLDDTFDFIIIIFERSHPLGIPGFPLILFFTAILLGILFSKFLMLYKKKERWKNSSIN
ncbi:MAG: hypothetical protein ACFFA6_14025 [Promethearchaeota archaeon]